MRLWIAIVTLVTAVAATGQSPRSQYEAIIKEYDNAYAAFVDATNKAGTDGDREKAAALRPRGQNFAPRIFALAEKHPDDPAAVDALTWIASQCLFAPEGEKALEILTSKYSRSQPIAAYVKAGNRYGEPFAPYEEFLRVVLKNNPDPKIQAPACITLAAYLKTVEERSESNLIRAALLGERTMVAVTRLNLNRLKERGLDNVGAESAALFERVIKQYADTKLENQLPSEAGAFAKEQLFELRTLCIGKKALEIEGQDISGKALKLSDYRGKVVVLDFGSHRYCGICRAIYPDLRSLVNQFEGKPFALIGINAGDDINELKGLASKKEITWSVLSDGDGEVGPITSRWVVRSVPTFYVLDRSGVIRNKGFLQLEELTATVEMLLKEMDAETPASSQ